MKIEEWFKKKIEYFAEDFEFRLETLILNITEKICERMQQKKINRTRLAEKLKVSAPAVTKILNGNSNFTLKTLLSVADALDLELKIDFVDRSTISKWIPLRHTAKHLDANEIIRVNSAAATFAKASQTPDTLSDEISYEPAFPRKDLVYKEAA